MSSATTGGHSASISPSNDVGASASTRYVHDTPYNNAEVVHLWRSIAPLTSSAVRIDALRSPQRAGEHHRMHHLIEAEIIPRLMVAHQHCVRDAHRPARRGGGIDAAQAETFALLLIAIDDGEANRFIETLLEQGHGEDVLFLELLAPAARHLGRMWELDTLSFSDVTIGLLRLHGMLRKLSARKEIPESAQRPDMRILLSAYPGETHIFGVRMVAEFFRHAGWAVNAELQQSVQALAERVASEWFAVIGVSLAADAPVGDIADLVTRLRGASCNRHVGIMLGGDLFNRRPELAALVGADLTANDGLTALAEAERWCDAVAVPYSMNAT